MSFVGGKWNRRHALEDRVQPLHAATADVHLAQEQIGEHAKQREHANDHHPCDSGSRVAMGPKQDPRDDSQLEQRDECDSEQRVVERCDHGEQGVGCEQGANLRGLRANGIRTRARLRREREENGSGEDSENDRPPLA